MPTLNWIGKAAIVEHHKEVLFGLLKSRDDFADRFREDVDNGI
jgi:hypothetical protein